MLPRPRYALTDFCACPKCRGPLSSEVTGLRCTACGAVYEVQDGIPILLRRDDEDDEIRARYRLNYERIARDDMEAPLEAFREARHATFLKFLGNQRGKKILDVGSSHGLYLNRVDADLKVGLDLALTYLKALPEAANTFRVCGDAELLPIRTGFFDSIVISDVLEHLLEPQRLVEGLQAICRPDTQVYVHIPWEEDLESYRSSSYEFTHLRRFDAYSFAQLFKGFDVERVVGTIPDLEQPLLFRLQGKLPAAIYNRLAAGYFEDPQRAEKDLAWRQARLNRLPEGEWWLLRFFPPKFKMFRLRLRNRRAPRMPVSETQTKDPGANRILMLVPHEPELDPRVMWAGEMCASISPTHVLGATASNEKPAREFMAGAFIERVNISESGSARAQRRAQRWGQLSTRKPALEYVARAGSRPAERSIKARLRHQLGAAQRFVSAIAWYHLLGDSLWRRARTLSVPPAVVLCHDIYALSAALKVKSRWGSRVVYDSHEYWPEADLLAQGWERTLTRAYERRLIRKADAVITVSRPLAEQLERTYKIKGVAAVPNACPRDLGVVPSSERRIEYPVRVLVQGRATQRRGFEELLDGWREFNDSRAVLDIRCPPSAYLEDLKSIYRDLVASGRVRFLSPVIESQLIAAAAQSDVGVIPYTGQTLNHLFACPNKLAQYMHAGLAIVSNDLPFIRSVVEQFQCGVVYQAGQPGSLASVMGTLVDDLKRLQAMKAAATKHAVETFNWEVQSKAYRDEITRLASGVGQ